MAGTRIGSDRVVNGLEVPHHAAGVNGTICTTSRARAADLLAARLPGVLVRLTPPDHRSCRLRPGARVYLRFVKDMPTIVDRVAYLDNVPSLVIFERMDAEYGLAQ